MHRFMAEEQLAGDLLGTLLQTQQSTGFFAQPQLASDIFRFS
jgi:hypothetical protein